MKKALFIIGLLLASCFPFAFSTDEGYGEDNPALGQFVDTFENLNNVSVTYQVERNATLNAMELNYTAFIPHYEDFTTYTEVDPANRMTIDTATHFTWVGVRQGDALNSIHKDYGAAYFGQDFEYSWVVNITEIEAGDATSRSHRFLFAVMNTNNNPITDPRITMATEQVGANDDIFTMSIRIDDVHAGWDQDFSGSLDVGTEYFCTLTRVGGDDVTMTIRTGSLTGPINDTLVTSLVNFDDNMRYVTAIWKRQELGDPNDWFSGTLELLWNQSSSGGYADGYFTTDDYMNDTLCNGTALGLMLNTTIPANTDITVEFSPDNATWVDKDGIAGGTIVQAGFETYDLRDINYTDVYMRFNLSTTNAIVTPRIYQARIISTIGNATAGGAGAGGSGAIGFIMLILICSPLILLVWGRRR